MIGNHVIKSWAIKGHMRSMQQKVLASSLNRKWPGNKIFVLKFDISKLWNCGLSDTTEINRILPWFVISIRLFKLPSFYRIGQSNCGADYQGPIRCKYFGSFPESSKGLCRLTSKISQTKDCHNSYKEIYHYLYE